MSTTIGPSPDKFQKHTVRKIQRTKVSSNRNGINILAEIRIIIELNGKLHPAAK